jgi:hypothetical protein
MQLRLKKLIALPALYIGALFSLGCPPITSVGEETDTDKAPEGPTSTTGGDSPTAGDDSPTDGAESGCVQRRDAALAVLEARCAGCHSGPAAKKFDYVTDLDRLLKEGKVAGGNPEESLLYQRISDGSMPEGGEPLAADEKETIHDWIELCTVPAPDNPLEPPQCKDNEFITVEQMLASMVVALNNPDEISIDDQPFIRFFTLTHLYNAGYCPEQLEAYRQGLSKLLNSLSSANNIHRPTAIDPNGTILLIDIRDYGWSVSLWELLMNRSAFAVEYLQPVAEQLKTGTQTNIPFHMADAFITDASQAPLYDEILYEHVLQIRSNVIENPLTRQELEAFLKIDVAANIQNQANNNDPGFVARAGFKLSGVSDQNRIIERHEIVSDLAYWLSYDFFSDAGLGNIQLHPLDFAADGGEIIFHLQNRMQAYLLVDKDGRRVNVADVQIVSNKEEGGEPIINGLSCMGCHAGGTRPAVDEIRDYVLSQVGVFEQETIESVENLYPVDVDFQPLLAQDNDTFQGQLEKADVALEVAGKEVISLSYSGFEEQELDLRRAAAELGLTQAQLLPKVGLLPFPLHALDKGKVNRDNFRNEYAAAICNLKLGITKACKPG